MRESPGFCHGPRGEAYFEESLMTTIRSLAGLAALRRLAALFCILSTGSLACGCVALAVGGAAAGAGGVAYAKGNKKRTYDHSIDTVSQAAMNALAELELNVAHANHDQLKGRIDAYTATGDHIKIKLENLGHATELDVRINTFGDSSMSQMILSKIDQNLPQSTGIAASHPLPSDAPAPAAEADSVPLQTIQPATATDSNNQ